MVNWLTYLKKLVFGIKIPCIGYAFGLYFIYSLKCPHRLAVRISPSHGGDTGSNPVGDAISFSLITVIRNKIQIFLIISL